MANRYDGATVEIINWAKYNPRKDLKATSWFRFQNSLFEDPNFIDFAHAELVALIYLLTLASKKQCETVKLNFTHAERIGRLNGNDLESAIGKLVAIQFVRITSQVEHADVTRTSRARTTTRRDETNVTRRDERDETVPALLEKTGTGDSGEGVRRAVWEAYADGYLTRHKVTPTRAAKENSLVKTFCQRVPASEAADIARYYVMSHNDALYVRARHPLDLLLRDYQRIRADWLAGQQMTGGKAREVERKQEIYDVFAPLIAEAEAKEAARGSS